MQKICAPVSVPEFVIGEHLRSLRQYSLIENGFRQFYFSLGRLYGNEAEEIENVREEVENYTSLGGDGGHQADEEIVSSEVKRFFKLCKSN